MLRALAGNVLWTASNARHVPSFARARRSPRQAQLSALKRFLRANARSAYGEAHGYDRIHTISDFQERVPIVCYEDLVPWIDRIAAGESGVLTVEAVRLLEVTSGSAGPCKLVPYTASLLAEFRRAVGVWMFDLFSKRPALLGGRQYWCITPLARRAEVTPGGVRVGLENDTEYLGALERKALQWALAVPEGIGESANLDDCWRRTIETLVRCRDLRFISVWSPSFLTLLLEHLPKGCSPRQLWPRLELISCWTAGPSQRFLPQLREAFGEVEIQGKGLIATEGIISIPLVDQPAPVAALTSHFLEFIDDDGQAHLVDELRIGNTYQVVITTGGGFARYDIGDRVRVIDSLAFEFVERAGGVSDLCGEKLDSRFVGSVIEAARERLSFQGFAMLAPEWDRPPHYTLFADAPVADWLARQVELGLRRSVHYDYCRRLGQLGAVEGVSVPSADQRYLQACLALGQRAGAVKSPSLRRELDWRERLLAG